MDVFRIAKTRHIRDLTGEGPRLYGGRWNSRGMAVVYTAESRSLASLEYLVHVPLANEPLDLSIATLSVPDDCTAEAVDIDALPKGWRCYPAPTVLADIGSDWVRRGESLVLWVPSVLVPDESSVIINPGHPEMSGVAIEDVRSYAFDDRLVKRWREA